MKDTKILMGHGSGGLMTHELIDRLFVRYFNNPVLQQQGDSALLPLSGKNLAFTTDSFVVDPVFFPGGNIGKLAVAGTVNDLAVSGAVPRYLSVGFILEEGLMLDELEEIVKTMAEEAARAGVLIATGDTKVVEKGKCDKIFINTSGVGEINERRLSISSGKDIRPGDKIIINGGIAEHGMAIMTTRNGMNISSPLLSDCASLNGLISHVFEVSENIRFMRDPTRGGLATVLSELVQQKDFGIRIQEDKLVIKDTVRGICELLGFDPLFVANEGKVVLIVPENEADRIVTAMREHPLGKETAVIGEITDRHPGKAWIETIVGGERMLDMLSGQQLPRIC
ncbi:hydrogenase expression/formation protein HypE [Candidatus Sulfidibacterium hydrothermale]|uniref:hydrogenase expression/formation protein HypE n=1 Tax=Candidatus Sulfidibacterium hydrothermale TaxID=2875962 RepID=UPI001F0AECBA|nr:hydrogenase expression/formation protein HypE [Candidatus Sulfidibacterium hydrothermale]UBM61152.1 hydrogenase expression/formation protein HypE [Candidatus Sulfidibacterium hydrothermale]